MALIVSKDGITVEYYSADGETKEETRFFSNCHATGRLRTSPSGSADWINQVYLADSEVDLFELMAAEVPGGYFPLGTSLASKDVTLISKTSSGIKAIRAAATAGDPKNVVKSSSLPGGFLVVMQTLKVCGTPVEAIPGSEFEQAWQDCVLFLLNL